MIRRVATRGIRAIPSDSKVMEMSVLQALRILPQAYKLWGNDPEVQMKFQPSLYLDLCLVKS